MASHTWNSGWEDVLVKDDEVLDKLVDQILELDLVSLLRNRDQGWAEADGQVVRVHHVLVAVLGQTMNKFISEKCYCYNTKFVL